MANENEGATDTSTTVDRGDDSITSLADLAQNFLPQVEEPQTETTEEAPAVEETPEVETQATETPETSEEPLEQSEDGEAEETEAEESNTGDVLSQHNKTLKKMRKRIDKATKNWRTAEEDAESLKSENESLKRKLAEASSPVSATAEKPQGFSQKVDDAESIDDLSQIQETAKAIIERAEDLILDMDESGDTEIEHNGSTLTKRDILEAKRDAQSATDKINAKAQMFQNREDFDRQALETFDFLRDTENEYYQFTEQIMSDPKINNFVNNREDGIYLVGLLVEGKRALDAKTSQSSNEKGKTEDQPKKAGSTQKIAPAVPGIGTTVAPNRSVGGDKSEQVRTEILKKNKHNVHDLTAYIAASSGT